MPSQHIRDQSEEIALEGIVVPLDLPEFHVVTQQWHADGSLRVRVIAINDTAVCPRCHKQYDQLHDCRERVKRDLSLRGYRVKLVVLKRRFRCPICKKPFTEPDEACGPRRRTTCRLREAIGSQVGRQTVAGVSQSFGVGPRFTRQCHQNVACPHLGKRGLQVDGQGKLPIPGYLGLDEFAVRKGHRYATILCDLENRNVLEVSMGRQFVEVVKLLGGLEHPEVVEAVSLDMSASFAPAVRCALPHAQLVIDHFHVIQHLMKAFRKVVSSWAHKKEGKILLHHKQQLFLRAFEELTPDQKQERARIGSHRPALETAWKLKEALRDWYARRRWKPQRSLWMPG